MIGYAIELLAAIPSIIYGMWGLFVFAPFFSETIQPFLTKHLGFLPFLCYHQRMDFNFFNQKGEKNNRKKGKGENKFSGSIAGAILIFMLITAFYLMVSDTSKNTPEISISDLAKSVSAGEIKKILVEGDKLTITYKNDETKTAKKETGSSLSQTFFNYGVKPEE